VASEHAISKPLRSLLIGLAVLVAVGAGTLLAMRIGHGQPMKTNAVDSASSDLAAGATAH
jgi:hypothetical protein